MFSGNMNAQRLKRILEAGLIPFINELFPAGHRLYQDNDPKNTQVSTSLTFSKNKALIGGRLHLSCQI